MRALDRKLVRDLWKLRGPAAAIALVLACGVATFVMAFSTFDALQLTQATFYRETRFADAFVSLKRAPEQLASRIAALPGIDAVETRVKAYVKLEVAGFTDPITGELASIPEDREPRLSDLYVRRGRLPEPYSDHEAAVSEAFAEAHGLEPGDQLSAVINGRYRSFTITGITLSAEYIYQIAPGGIFPDYKRFGVLWLRRNALATAYNMEGAFNDLAVSVSKEANMDEVLARLDELLRPYGGLGAYSRENQLSHRYLSEEFKQLDQMATIWPIIFLGVAAFLLNVVVHRLVRTEREQIAVLKAFGYRNIDVAFHYLKLTLLIVAIGAAGGVSFGVWSGKQMGAIYIEYYRFPYLKYALEPGVVLISVMISAATALAGTWFAVREAAALEPAVAMRPEPPTRFRRSFVERLGLGSWLSQPARIIVRNMERTPVKTLLSMLGIALACSILIVGMFFGDALTYMIDVQFKLVHREDLAVSFTEPTSERARFEFRQIPGVGRVEGFRTVPVRLRKGHRSYRTSITGLDVDPDLGRVLNTQLRPIPLPGSRLVVTEYLGTHLGIAPGDTVSVEVLEGTRPVREVVVGSLVRQFVGQGCFMDRDALNHLLREGRAINGVYLAVDERFRSEAVAALNERPRVAGAIITAQERTNFYETIGSSMLTFAFVMVLFAGAIAFAVVYNSARISFSERAREMASLRVLGFTRGEIAYILLGELAILTLLALPPGFFLGWVFSASMVSAFQNDLFYFPLVIRNSSYATSAVFIMISAALSSLFVLRRIRRLDLVEVLKTRE